MPQQRSKVIPLRKASLPLSKGCLASSFQIGSSCCLAVSVALVTSDYNQDSELVQS